MKNLIGILLTVLVISTTKQASGQNINWRSLTGQKNVVNANIGLDYGATFGVGYGRMLGTKIPVILNTEFSLPAGKTLFDDYKLKLGGQSEVFKAGNFSTTIKAYGVIRRYQSELVKLMNYGSEFSAVTGYYKPRWYAAVEFGFDKAITTHIANSSGLKEYFPAIHNGWFIPTGGNYFYGVQSGVSFKKMDFNIKVGKTIAQGFETSALLPFYFQVGVNRRF